MRRNNGNKHAVGSPNDIEHGKFFVQLPSNLTISPNQINKTVILLLTVVVSFVCPHDVGLIADMRLEV